MEAQKLKILAIDDNQDNLMTLAAVIADAFPEASVLTALNGRAGMQLALAEDPDVIVLDIVMPEMDGFEVCRNLKQDECLAHIPVVFLTGLIVGRESRIKALEVGAEAFLTKPIEGAELTAQIRAMAKIKAANVSLRDERERLTQLVAERTRELQQSQIAALNLLEDLRTENEARKKSEEALHCQKEMLQVIFDSVPVMIGFLDRQGRHRLVNRCWQSTLGWSLEEAMYKDVFMEIYPDPAYREHVLEFIKSAEGIWCDFTIRTRDGRVLDTSWIVVTLSDGSKIVIGIDVTERKKAEEHLRRQIALTVAINRVLQGALKAETDAEVAHICLSEAEELTGSKSGWIGELNPAGCLDTIALSEPGGEPCRIHEAQMATIKGLEIRGIFGRVLKDGKALITNEPGAHPDRVGLPSGHPELTAFLGVPLKQDDRTVGMVALGNKPSGYVPNDQEAVEVLSVAFMAAFQSKRAEAALRESEERFVTAFQKSPVTMMITSAVTGLHVEVNEVFLLNTGFSRDEVIGHTSEELGVFCDLSDRERLLTQVREEGFANCVEIRFRMKAGDIRDGLISTQMIQLHGEPHLLSSIIDVTERQQAETERERLMAAIEQAGEIVIITDPEGTIQYVNPAFETLTGYLREEAVGKTPRILKSGRQDPAFYRKLWDTITSGRTWEGRLVNKRKDGTLYTEDATISPVRDSSGRIVNYVAVKRDITEQLKLADQFEQAQKMESVGRLAGGVAHDFNNMLGVILGYAEIALYEAACGTPLHDSLTEIRKAAHRSADLTRQLLAFARKQTINPRVLDLNGTVEGMFKMLRRLIGEDIELAWRPGADLWPIKMDPAQIDQILANFCVNARDAIADLGTVTIETANVSLDELYCATHAGFAPGEFVMLTVSDDGCGMDEETRRRLFEPFFTTKDAGKGTGLGLSTVYGIVKQNNGFLDVYSELGQGTTFKIYLPRHTGSIVETRAAGAMEFPQGHGETVLLVEDEPTMLNMSREMLERLGYTILTAGSPGEAIRLAGDFAGEIHLLMTDVVMPEMNGRELADRLLTSKPGMKCLFMSGYPANVIAHHGVLEGGVQFIQKPFSVKDLAQKVREGLDRDGRAPAASPAGLVPGSGAEKKP